MHTCVMPWSREGLLSWMHVCRPGIVTVGAMTMRSVGEEAYTSSCFGSASRLGQSLLVPVPHPASLCFPERWENQAPAVRGGGCHPAAMQASSDSAEWGVFMSSRNSCKSGTSLHLWPGHPLPYWPLALKSFQRGLEPKRGLGLRPG